MSTKMVFISSEKSGIGYRAQRRAREPGLDEVDVSFVVL